MLRGGFGHNRVIATFCITALAGICGIAWAMVPRVLPAQDEVNSFELVQQQVDQHIPFHVVAGEEPGATCDPVDLELLVITDPEGQDLDYRWRITKEGGAMIECGDFYELYYRCDGQSCYQMRVVRRPGTTGKEIVSAPVHVCLK